MGLPTSIPSGGDGRDRFSAALPEPEPSIPLPEIDSEPAAVDPDRAEYEEFQRWKRERESKAPQPPSPARTRAPRTSPAGENTAASPAISQDQPLPKSRVKRISNPQTPLEEHQDAPNDGQWAMDAKTGKRYRVLPSTPKEALAAYKKTKGAGFSLSEIKALLEVEEDFDIDNLNQTAETFMAHLRVPPSAAEREEILRKKAELTKQQKAERAELDQELNAKEGTIEEPEADPFNEATTKKRGLFGRKN